MLLIGVTILLASSYVTLTGPERVERHDSVVKLGQPIQHHEDDLAIHDDEELKKKLSEMNDQRPDQEKVNYVEPGHETLKTPLNKLCSHTGSFFRLHSEIADVRQFVWHSVVPSDAAAKVIVTDGQFK